MKQAIKHVLRRLGLYYPVLDVLGAPAVFRWLRRGCPAPAPPAIKRRIVRSYVQRYGVEAFVETGTYLGDTLEWVARTGVHCISVELSPFYFGLARARFAGMANVELVQGDSRDVLPGLLGRLKRPALFWLDGHYSGGNTAKGESETPIVEELRSLLAHRGAGDVILIDDARCFGEEAGYPAISEILRMLGTQAGHAVEVSNDIIRIVPGSRPSERKGKRGVKAVGAA